MAGVQACHKAISLMAALAARFAVIQRLLAALAVMRARLVGTKCLLIAPCRLIPVPLPAAPLAPARPAGLAPVGVVATDLRLELVLTPIIAALHLVNRLNGKVARLAVRLILIGAVGPIPALAQLPAAEEPKPKVVLAVVRFPAAAVTIAPAHLLKP